ncbi:hypothetical protein [Chryseobacterium phocaeense]|uniref:hypothetical protein n=1 Tax=Chryseobacterium phocaeense TaxID=1816690 RepID=UPI0009BA64AA|nr:hypothetical protein [Chryseobacterium phocaeense]
MPYLTKNRYQTIIYSLDEVKKTFRQYRRKDLNSTRKDHFLPELLRIEKNNGYNTFSGFNNLLRLRDASSWSVCTRLGLRPTGVGNFYCTDVIIEERKLLCIVYYSKDNQFIELSIFPEFYPCEKSVFKEKIIRIVQSVAHKKGI